MLHFGYFLIFDFVLVAVERRTAIIAAGFWHRAVSPSHDRGCGVCCRCCHGNVERPSSMPTPMT